EGFRRTVGVQGRQYQVTGLRGLDGDLGGFQVADLTDHDDVGVLAQKRAQRVGKRQPHPGVHLDLVDAFEVDFHRVFGGGDVAFGGIENVEAGVQRYGFTAAGGAGHQNHALVETERFEIGVAL